LGVVLLVYSVRIARRYIAWTTRLRERHPKILRPQTLKARELNTTYMMWLIRFIGAFVIVDAVFELSRLFIWR
jgi:hypothetical protein